MSNILANYPAPTECRHLRLLNHRTHRPTTNDMDLEVCEVCNAGEVELLDYPCPVPYAQPAIVSKGEMSRPAEGIRVDWKVPNWGEGNGDLDA